jgi:hypothetical protein
LDLRNGKESSVAKSLSGKIEAKPKPSAPRKKNGDGSGATDDAFEQFWREYPRKVAKEAAKRAWAAAIKRGTTPAALIAGAQRYAIERQGQDPKFTKHPATWLNGGCWMDELNGTPVIDETGALVGVEPPQPRPALNSFAAIAEAMREESERGKLLGTHDPVTGFPIWGRRR